MILCSLLSELKCACFLKRRVHTILQRFWLTCPAHPNSAYTTAYLKQLHNYTCISNIRSNHSWKELMPETRPLSGVPTERQSRSLNLIVVRPTSDSGKRSWRSEWATHLLFLSLSACADVICDLFRRLQQLIKRAPVSAAEYVHVYWRC